MQFTKNIKYIAVLKLILLFSLNVFAQENDSTDNFVSSDTTELVKEKKVLNFLISSKKIKKIN